MSAALLQKLAKKKGGVLLLIQNTTDLPINVLSGSLTAGKPEKGAPMPTLIAPLSQHEVGFHSPEGQWSFGVQGDSTYKTRLTLLHSAEHANLERLPPSCPWTADLQQNWKADVPQIVVTFTIRDNVTSSSHSSPSKNASTHHKSDHSDSQAGSGKIQPKKSAKDSPDRKSKKESGDEESGGKKKKAAKKPKETIETPTESEHTARTDHVAHGTSSSAFGIDAFMGYDSSSDEDGELRGTSGWGRKFVIHQRSDTPDTESEDAVASLRRASLMISVGSNAKKTTPQSPTPTTGDDDFFKDLDLVRSVSSRHLSMPPGDRERKLKEIPASAHGEFNNAMENLNNGDLQQANASLHAALSQLSELAFRNNTQVATQWCFYAQLLGILIEMERLKSENLFAQRALLARFVGLLGLRLDNPQHALICMRMAVNRNLEMENFRTTAQLLQSMNTMRDLTDMDREHIAKKQQICASHNYSEAHIPSGALLDQVSGQFLLNGYSYAICLKTMQLIRDPTHNFCPYCDATFSERATPERRCSFCDSALQTQT